MISSKTLSAALARIASHTEAASEELCSADGALGDGDLGITVSKGFAEAAATDLPEDIGMALLAIAKAFQRVSSSSYGTLLATGFMAAAKMEKGKTKIDPAGIPGLVAAARDAMMARGKGHLGDKTVLDSLDAVANALDHAPLEEMINVAIAAAAETAEQYRGKPNKLGRARMFGERSIGLLDPGQLAFLRIVEALRA
ncbi:PTS-dependent dihydroxyacetone kinase [Nitratireductor aquibiodomus RA22]|uniref:PTS-dependent dihydroxyacetone kinase n=1 Tax=Nitratireductor aquibiodomus RA22 TaxID=1189611 RepID=I5C410_9HYPH|nr:dihydroxyacetone kinase subunit L [Nitratireductor aquibiodomus]EIM76562.1 PTS-dependent dihydroxyacetone kinase [Nitratireductor aquibiodomus RA22]